MPDFQTESTRRARTEHRCEECRGLILPGQEYRRVAGSWDGGFEVYKQCLQCLAARDWALAQPEWSGDGEYLYYFGQLQEELHGLASEIKTGDGRRMHALRLVVEMRKRGSAARQLRKAA